MQTSRNQIGNPDHLDEFMQHFFEVMRSEPALMEVFSAIVGSDLDRHKDDVVQLWSAVLTGRFSGEVPAYRRLLDHAQLTSEHFCKWLTLWNAETTRWLPAYDANQLQLTAQAIARNAYFEVFGHFVQFSVEGDRVVGVVLDPYWADAQQLDTTEALGESNSDRVERRRGGGWTAASKSSRS